MGPARIGSVERKTVETDIRLRLNLDGHGDYQVSTGIPFFDHMLCSLAKHGLLDLELKAVGDIQIDFHHTVEDVGICFGKAVAEALGDKAGVLRFGQGAVPMDEALAEVTLDLSGRPFLVYHANLPKEKVGEFDLEVVQEFFKAVAIHAGLTLHINVPYGSNFHHIVESVFKAFGRALSAATRIDPRIKGVPSVKGVL
ncbi:MAG: imidazoleglycerol-phosphate dehydratase HisB [Deltaproteobacteria bacterium]|nr:imidazoleglycerol-phosphate dehydratase HisB [Deltaproteobacteria bacterium]MBI3077247.1 imidazoleglycerol-phosphate dehydratase HisB [Deltaproteobacteria bacterium]